MLGIPTTTVDELPTPLPEGLTVLDVREPLEWVHGHVEGSRHVPMHDVPERLDELAADSQVMVVCRVGARSAQVVAYLQQRGVDAVNLAGGLLAWEAAGRPLVSEAGEPTVV